MVPYSQIKETSSFETEEEPDLSSGPVVGVAALPSLNPLWGQSPLFLKDKSSLKLGTSIVSFCRIPEVLQLSHSIPFFVFLFPLVSQLAGFLLLLSSLYAWLPLRWLIYLWLTPILISLSHSSATPLVFFQNKLYHFDSMDRLKIFLIFKF